jgi:hypothetical protein
MIFDNNKLGSCNPEIVCLEQLGVESFTNRKQSGRDYILNITNSKTQTSTTFSCPDELTRKLWKQKSEDMTNEYFKNSA